MQLLFDLLKLLWENFCLGSTGINFLFQNLGSSLKHLNASVLNEITDSVAFVVRDDALWANIYLVVLAEVFCLFLRVTDAVLDIALGNFALLSICSI